MEKLMFNQGKKPSASTRDELSSSDTENTYLQPNSLLPVKKPEDDIDVKADPGEQH